MSIINVKIHPALGIARVGNSPDEFFIGPEHPWDRSIPEGGYKDNQCRVKRQAACFRIFAYHKNGSVTEVTEEEASISWTVHLVNKKASVKKRYWDEDTGEVKETDRNPICPECPPIVRPTDLIIDPGSRVLTGPNQREVLDTGQIRFPCTQNIRVPLGEARTDDVGHLLILGGFGQSNSPTRPPKTITHYCDNAGWYDDTSDGKVNATVRIRETREVFEASGAWVVVAPPKFAPGLDNVITLYDILLDIAVKEKWMKEPTTTSYTQDIYPILERARTVRWVQKVGEAHLWPDPVVDIEQRNNIFIRVSSARPSTDMPNLKETGLTSVQFEHMKRWNAGTFINDWSGPPVPSPNVTPEGLDKAALENAVGGAFKPGIEVGGIFKCPILDPSNYIAPFRLNHLSLEPGDLTAYMAVPWQADFYACQESWWPVPRPNHVLPSRTFGSRIEKALWRYLAWDRDVGGAEAMVKSWHTLGFVTKQGNEYFEGDRCARASITLLTPVLNFHDVQRGPSGMSRITSLPVIFEVISTKDAVTLEFQSGPKHPRLTILEPSVTVGPTTGSGIATARLWVTYETGAVGEVLTDQVVIRNPTTYQTWTIYITANTVEHKPMATALVIDRRLTGSMHRDPEDAQTNYKSVQEALSVFVDMTFEGEGIAAIAYDESSQLLQDVTPMGSSNNPFDPARLSIKNTLIGQHSNPSEAASIGAGISEGLHVLNATRPGYYSRAIILLTYTKENNHSPQLADIGWKINLPIYSVNLGLPQNRNTQELQAISGNSGGYSMLNGNISAYTDRHSIFTKDILQIFACINNAWTVLNSNGDLIPDLECRIPFNMTEVDTGIDVILFSPSIQNIDFFIQTPIGFIIDPMKTDGKILHVLSNNACFYRIVLPVELEHMRFDRAGTWHVLLKIKQSQTQRPDLGSSYIETSSSIGTVNHKAKSLSQDHKIPFDLLVQAYSNLTFTPYVEQNNYEPGATMSLYASIAESGIPLQTGATSTWAEITRPDNASTTLNLDEIHDGQFSAAFHSTIPGIYRFRMRASGRSRTGYPFQREQTLTNAVWIGGNNG